jgi:PAS domain S-box-containing protein
VRALEESEDRFRALSAATFEAVAIHDQGIIVEANQSFAAMFGYPLAEVIGRGALEFAAPRSRELVLQKIRSGATDPYEATGLRKDGSTFVGELRGKPIQYRGRAMRVTAIRDITERKRAEDAIREAKREMEFCHDLLAHDLTNINHALLGNLTLLEKTPLDARQRRRVDAGKRQAARSDQLVTRIMAFAAVKGVAPGALGPVDLNRSVRNVVEMAAVLHPGKRLSISFDPSEERTALGTALIDTVLANLVENAVKHSSRDEVGIEITVSAAGQPPDERWVIAVADDGPGIPDPVKASIFERYARAGEAKGVGLGLSLARLAVERFGGRLWVEDRLEGGRAAGSVFKIELRKG